MKVFVKNLISLSLGEVVSKILGFIATIYLARTLTPDYYGHIGFAISVTSYFSLIINFGFDTIGIRESSRNPHLINKLVNNIVALRVLFTCIAFLLISIFLIFSDFEKSRLLVLIIFSFLLFSNTFSFQWIFKGMNRMKPIAYAQIIGSLIILIFILFFVKSPDDLLIAAIITVCASLFPAIYLYYYYRQTGKTLSFECDKTFWRYLVREAYPIFISAAAITIYYNLDIVLLGFMRSTKEVGEYAAAYRIHATMIVPASLILSSLIPQLSKSFEKLENQRNISYQYARLMFLTGIPLSAFVFFNSSSILSLIFGSAYIEASFALSVLALNAAFVFINMSYGNPLPIWFEQKKYMWCILAGGIVNIILNAILIPPFGYNGASIATLLSEVIVFVGLFPTYYRILKVSNIRILLSIVTISYLTCYLINLTIAKYETSIFLEFIIYLITVYSIALLFRIFTLKDIKLVFVHYQI